MSGRGAAVFAAGVLAFVACSGAGGSGAGDVRPRCAPAFVPPSGFTTLETFEESFDDHVGTRRGFRDGRGRELHVFAGIPGEFGEGLPDAGTIRLVTGRTASLFGGAHRVWVLIWREGGACDPRVVLGSGFDRTSFRAVLEQAGLVPA